MISYLYDYSTVFRVFSIILKFLLNVCINFSIVTVFSYNSDMGDHNFCGKTLFMTLVNICENICGSMTHDKKVKIFKNFLSTYREQSKNYKVNNIAFSFFFSLFQYVWFGLYMCLCVCVLCVYNNFEVVSESV